MLISIHRFQFIPFDHGTKAQAGSSSQAILAHWKHFVSAGVLEK